MSSSGKAPGGGGGGKGKGVKLNDDLVRIVYGYGDAKEPVQVRGCVCVPRGQLADPLTRQDCLTWEGRLDQPFESICGLACTARRRSSRPHITPNGQESVELLERMVHEYVGEMCRQVRDHLTCLSWP